MQYLNSAVRKLLRCSQLLAGVPWTGDFWETEDCRGSFLPSVVSPAEVSQVLLNSKFDGLKSLPAPTALLCHIAAALLFLFVLGREKPILFFQ